MKSSTILAGACLLALLFTITECNLTLDIIKRQDTPCGNPNDPNTPLGRCTQAALDQDIDTVCGDCLEVIEDFYECAGIEDNPQLDQLREECDSAAGVGAALVSIISALAVALAASLN